jgi:hypothetical protein
MDPSTPPHPDTPIPVQPLSPAQPTTKRPWFPPRLTAESTSSTSHVKPHHEPTEQMPRDHGPAS